MRIALVLMLVLLAACRQSDDDAVSGSSTRDTLSELGSASNTPTLNGACSAMSRVTRGTLRIAVGRDRSRTFPAASPDTGSWQGCRLVGNGTLHPDVAAPESLLHAALAAEGWTPDAKFTAT